MEYVPFGQFVHTLTSLAPTVIEYLPAEQPMQTLEVLAPDTLEYAPAGQPVQLVAPTTFEKAPAGQLLQLALPVTFLYFPTAHATHADPSVPVYPILHLQSDTCMLFTALIVLTGQATQVL
jgi:hypothetical protein